MDFISLDVETANPSFSSICQIGIAQFRNGELEGTWSTLVDPQDYFDDFNIELHGITERQVRGAPLWGEVFSALKERLSSFVIASHTSFDRSAIHQACRKYDIAVPDMVWLNTASVARRAWPEFSAKGYGLANIATHFDIQFNHHNAEEDARAAGELLVKAAKDTGLSLEQWIARVKAPINLSDAGTISRQGNADGPLYGERLVFTGALAMSRREAADAAAIAGCQVDPGVTKKTTVLVVGDQDISKLAGKDKSSKHQKAEELIKQGLRIRIIGETDFKRLLESAR